MASISIPSMLIEKFDSPLFPGNVLGEVGKFLGVPDRWDFGIEDEFICQLGYGDFELNLRTRANRVEVERIWIELWDTPDDKPTPKRAPIRLARHLRVDLGQFEPGLSVSAAKTALDSKGIPYEEYDQNDASETVKRLVLPSGGEFYFFGGDPEPSLMEIHFASKRPLA